jgi:biopolymer transport protein ExbD
MSVRLPTVEETSMNMTPMIDIVFQLIVFFLLTLRFVSPEARIDAAMPRDRGPLRSAPVPLEPRLSVSVFRHGLGDEAVTRVRVAGLEVVEVPGPGAARDAALERVHDAVRRAHEASGDGKATIRARPPTGGSVPHGDVVAVLDQLVRAGLTDIAFEGTALHDAMR